MPRGRKQQLIAAYIICVGTCLAALAGILATGRTSQAPPSVAGLWTIRLAADSALPSGCTAWLAGIQRSPLQVAQSGRWLSFTWGDAGKSGMAARLDGNVIQGQMDGPVCGGSVRLDAVVGGRMRDRALAGRLSLPNCSTCAVHAFEAARVLNVSRKETAAH